MVCPVTKGRPRRAGFNIQFAQLSTISIAHVYLRPEV